jgi:putative hydrolase of the HAD superfamily
MTIKAVLFDLGGTLLHYKAVGSTWEDMEKGAMGSVYHRLAQAGYSLPPEAEALNTAWEYLLSLWSSVDHRDPATLTIYHQLAELLRSQWGLNSLPANLIETLAPIYIQAIQMLVSPLDGAAEMLRTLRQRGLKIGLISNTLWPEKYHLQDLERHHLVAYLDHLIFSADAAAWKPHAQVFRRGLAALGVQPEEAVFVGDSLYFDVWGAQQAGLRGVWIIQDHRWLPDGIEVHPDAEIHQLAELPGIVQSWSHNT